jgi:hypothetical protein
MITPWYAFTAGTGKIITGLQFCHLTLRMPVNALPKCRMPVRQGLNSSNIRLTERNSPQYLDWGGWTD